MPTSYMKLPHEAKVLKDGALRRLSLNGETVGFSLDIGLNYYRGLPLSAVEGHAFHLDDAHEQLDRHLRLEQRILGAHSGRD